MDSDESTQESYTVDVRPLCFYGVRGYQGRQNDALLKPSIPSRLKPNVPQRTLVFFGGDIQNFMHLMDHNDDNINYRRWCLEAAASRLGRDFPDHHIVVIKPTRITFDHISCFDNFVDGNFLGSPTHMYRYVGLLHLEKILKKISKTIKQVTTEELCKMLLKQQDEEDYLDADDLHKDSIWHWQFHSMSSKSRRFLKRWQETLCLHKYPLTLVGFSKGCTVLNQFLYEFHFAKRLEPKMQDSSFVDRIESIYFLDASNAGSKNIYLTSRGLLRTVAELRITVRVHTSQFQLDDRDRLHIRMQWIVFIKTLREFKANVSVYRHLVATADLNAHLGILLNFKNVQHSFIEVREIPLPPRQAPPPAPPDPTSQPAPPPPPHPTPSERNPLLDELLGISLIKPSSSPHFGIQTILRRPMNDIMKKIIASKRSSPGNDSEATDNTENDTDTQDDGDADDTDSDDQSHVTRMDHENMEDFAENMEQFTLNLEPHMDQLAQNIEHVVRNAAPVAQNTAQAAFRPYSDPVMQSVFAISNSYNGQGTQGPSTSQNANFSQNILQAPGTSQHASYSQVPSTSQNVNFSQTIFQAGTSQHASYSQVPGTSQHASYSQVPGTSQNANFSQTILQAATSQHASYSQVPDTLQNANFSQNILQAPGSSQHASYSQVPSTSQNVNFSQTIFQAGTSQHASYSQVPGTSQNANVSQNILQAPGTSQHASYSQIPSTSQNDNFSHNILQAGTSQHASYSQVPGTSQNANFSQNILQAPGTSQHAYFSQLIDTLQADNTQVPGTFSPDNLQDAVSPVASQPGTDQPENSPQVRSTSSGSTSSHTQQPEYDYTVCMTVKNDRFDFQTDQEAIEIFKKAKYFKMDYPVVAIAHDRDEPPGIDIFIPEERMHTARVLNRLSPDFIQRIRATVSSRSSSRADNPSSVSARNNLPSDPVPPQNILLSALQGIRIPRTDVVSRQTDSNRVSSIERVATHPRNVANDTPRWNTYTPYTRVFAPLNATNATLHVNIAVDDSTNRDRTVSENNSGTNAQPDSGVSNLGNSPDVMDDPLELSPSQSQSASNTQAIAGGSGLDTRSSTGAIPRTLRARRNRTRNSSTRYNLRSMK